MKREFDRLCSAARGAHDRGDHALAIEFYQKALVVEPEDADSLYDLAICLRAEGRYEEALAVLRRCVDLQPDAADVWYALGNLRRSMRDLEGAAEAYSESLRLSPGYVDSINNLALTLRNLGRYDEAESLTQTGLSLYPYDPELNYNLGILRMEDDPRDAVAYFRRCVVANPDYVEAWEHLSKLYETLGELGEAVETRLWARNVSG